MELFTTSEAAGEAGEGSGAPFQLGFHEGDCHVEKQQDSVWADPQQGAQGRLVSSHPCPVL